MNHLHLTPGGIATLACLLEVTAPKPGNVHRAADFEDVSFVDFATSAVVLGSVLDACRENSLGQTVLESVVRTKATVGTNTNLGIVLLLVPLAKIVKSNTSLELGTDVVSEYLSNLTETDGAGVFEAIRLAKPGGLGKVEQSDVNSGDDGLIDLLAAMQLAADRDAIARQYVSGYRDVFEVGVPLLTRGRGIFYDLGQAIVYAHVAWMAREPDSLIARKCGLETAQHAQFMASKAIDCLELLDPNQTAGEEELESFWSAVGELDFWLRSDGHRRNPGTTADLIAASLFVGIHNGIINAPFR